MKNVLIKISAAIIFVLTTLQVAAQNVREISVPYLKQNVNGYAGDYKVSKSYLQNITQNYFSSNLKGKRIKNKDFYQYKGVNWNKISIEKADVYYKINGNKSSSTLIILVSKGYDNYVSSSTDAQLSNELKAFFTDFNKEIEKHTLSQRIEEQKKVVERLEKEHKSLLEEENKMNKKINDIEKEKESNKKKYEEKNNEILRNRQILEDMKK